MSVTDPTATVVDATRVTATAKAAVKAAKPFYMTSEFWAALAAAVVPHVMATVPDETAAKVTGGVAGAYAIGRSLLKLGALLGLRR